MQGVILSMAVIGFTKRCRWRHRHRNLALKIEMRDNSLSIYKLNYFYSILFSSFKDKNTLSIIEALFH